jgi:hypothetical protein
LRVVIYDDASGHFISDTWTYVDGTYSVKSLPSGNYHVYVETYSTEYLPEYYNNAPDLGSATPVAVTDGATTGGIDIMLDDGTMDSDGDGLPDAIENGSPCLDAHDADTDNDGIIDGDEDVNHNGGVDPGETDPCDADTDDDGIQDGTEQGVTTGHPTDTDVTFIPDADGGATTTDPLDDDSDNDNQLDGEEDTNCNGMVDAGESNPLLANIPGLEREALIALYNNTDADNWTDNSGWKEPPLHTDGFAMPGTENTWYGVTCDAGNTYVLEIDLSSNGLSGTIPGELGNLANLQYLFLSPNQLTGSIPAELGDLNNLENLALGWNQLTGSIPPELGDLDSLQYLQLSNNALTGSIPAELGNLANLRILTLKENQLTGSIPPELGDLANMIILSLSFNQLTGSIPSELGDLDNLGQLWLYSNQLTGSIPPELGDLINLQGLNLHSNQLTGSIPPELGDLANLESLDLFSNQLTGRIPTELKNLSSLSYLDICDNHLYATDPDLRDFLDTLQPVWEDCQTPPYGGSLPFIPLLLFDD